MHCFERYIKKNKKTKVARVIKCHHFLRNSDEFELTFLDDEGDRCVINSDSELKVCVEILKFKLICAISGYIYLKDQNIL